ncbi:MAG: AAA family ATPase [Candidatus Nanoarchaeia archaeon]|nr:AAA family ATPase [Candidatus Nanoarchaeia archaeon]
MITSIASGKGGTAKSSTATNLSYYYSQLNQKVLLLDLDWGMSDTFYFFNIQPAFSIYDYLYKEVLWDQLKYKVNKNLDLIIAGQGKKEIANITEENKLKVCQEIKKQIELYDIIIFDTAPGIHNNVTDFLKISNQIVVIVNEDLSSIADGYNLIKILVGDKVMSDIFILVAKSSNSKNAYDIYQRMRKVCNKYLNFTPKYLGNIDYSMLVQKAFAKQTIFMDQYRHTHIGKQIQAVGESLWLMG